MLTLKIVAGIVAYGVMIGVFHSIILRTKIDPYDQSGFNVICGCVWPITACVLFVALVSRCFTRFIDSIPEWAENRRLRRNTKTIKVYRLTKTHTDMKTKLELIEKYLIALKEHKSADDSKRIVVGLKFYVVGGPSLRVGEYDGNLNKTTVTLDKCDGTLTVRDAEDDNETRFTEWRMSVDDIVSVSAHTIVDRETVQIKDCVDIVGG
jgi:hypothetical protein